MSDICVNFKFSLRNERQVNRIATNKEDLIDHIIQSNSQLVELNVAQIRPVIEKWFASGGQITLSNVLASEIGKEFKSENTTTEKQIKDILEFIITSLENYYEGQEDNPSPVINWSGNMDQDVYSAFKGNIILDSFRLKEFKRDVFRLLFFKTVNTRSTNAQDIKLLQKYLGTDEDNVDILLEQASNTDLGAAAPEYQNAYTNLKFDSKQVIQSNEDLNIAIIQYKEKLYKTIAKFLKQTYPDIAIKSYMQKGKVNIEYVNDLMSKMLQHIQSLSDESGLLSQWELKRKKTKDTQSYLELEAINSFLNLKYFDENLKSECGDVFNIDEDWSREPNKTLASGAPLLKYTIGTDRSAAPKDWTKGEFADAIAETTKEQQLLIATLRMHDFDTKSISLDSISQSQISISWGKLCRIAALINSKNTEISKFVQNVLNFHDNPHFYANKIFKFLFANTADAGELRRLIFASSNQTFQQTDLNILYSLYCELFESPKQNTRDKTKEPTVSYIEYQNIISGTDSLLKYLKQDLILGILDRMQPATYTRTKMDLQEGKVVNESVAKNDYLKKSTLDKRDSLLLKLKRLRSYEETAYMVDKYDLKVPNPSTLQLTLGKGVRGAERVFTFIGRDNNSSLTPFFQATNIAVIPSLTNSEIAIIQEQFPDMYTNDILQNIFYDYNRNKKEELLKNIKDLMQKDPTKEPLLKPIQELIETFISPEHTNSSIINSSYGAKVRSKILELNMGDLKAYYQHEILNFMNYFLNMQLNSEDGLQTLGMYGSNTGQGNNVSAILLTAAHIASITTLNNEYYQQHKNTRKDAAYWNSYLEFYKSRNFNIELGNSDSNFQKNGFEYYFNQLGNIGWMDQWFKAKANLEGSETQATTADNKGNRVANFRPTNLAAQYYYYLNSYKQDSECAPHETLFVQNSTLIKECVYDQDMESWDSSKKAVKDATTPELIRNGIMHSFWARYLNPNTRGEIQIMPTVYSDKTSFVSYVIDANQKLTLSETINGKTITYIERKSLLELNEEESQLVYKKTVGGYFKKSYDTIISDFSKLINFVNGNTDNKVYSTSFINSWLKQICRDSKTGNAKEILENYIKQYNKSNTTKINIATETHFRYKKSKDSNGDPNGYLYLNELVVYYGENQFTDANLKERFNLEKRQFIENLLKTGVSFWYDSKFSNMKTVLQQLLENPKTAKLFRQETQEIKDLKREQVELEKALEISQSKIIELKKKNDDDSKKELNKEREVRDSIKKRLTEIKNKLDAKYHKNFNAWLQEFKKSWFKHGKLILAKDSQGNNIESLSDLKTGDEIKLNPILEKYFYVDNLVSANIKYAMTGSEVADPDKSGINLQKDFDLESKNSDKTDKTEEQKKLLNSLSGTLILKQLQHSDLTSLHLFIQDIPKKIHSHQLDIEHWKAERDVLMEIAQKIQKGVQPSEDDMYQLTLHYDMREDIATYTDMISNLPNEIEELTSWIDNKEKELRALQDPENIKTLNKIYKNLIYRIIATSEGSQYKRNVIWTATRTDVQRMALTGVGESTNVAIIDDLQAPIFTPNGKNGTEDADDGSAVIIPQQAILENNSLAANAVGYTNKKPIWHYYDPRTGTCVLLKFATFTLSNGQMLTSMNADKSHYNLFKKMTHKQWGEGKYDLLNSVAYQQTIGTKLDFTKHIVGTLPSQSKGLYYKDGSEIYQILDMIENNGIYYTKELNTRTNEITYVAQIFDQDGNSSRSILRSKTGLSNEQLEAYYKSVQDYKSINNLHTINSIFELHDALGGVYSQELNAKGEFINSENSHYAVVGFMNNVCIKKEDNDTLDQYTYEQPLKKEFIGYAANKSSVKRGQFNMQSSKRWTDDKELIYTTLDTKGLGTQMDADHTADEGELSEPTQVIAALDAGGYAHDIAKQAFEDIGRAVESGLRVNMGEITQLIKKMSNKDLSQMDLNQIESRIRDIFARQFVKTFKARNTTDLSQSIINALRQQFLISDDHSNDEFKLPLSDPNLFSQVVSDVTSTLNKKGLKRKYAGLGTVMCPGYKNAQIYHIGKNDYTYADIVKKARKQNSANISDDVDTITNFGSQPVNLGGYNVHVFKQFTNTAGWNPDAFRVEASIDLIETDDPNTFIFQSRNMQNATNLEKARMYLAIRKFLPITAKIVVQDGYMPNDRQSYLDLLEFRKYGFISTESQTFNIPEQFQNIPDFEYITNEQTGQIQINVPHFKLGQLSSVQEDKLLVEAYLKDEQQKQDQIDWNTPNVGYRFQPTDMVKVVTPTTETLIDLDEVKNYYAFKEWVQLIDNASVQNMFTEAENVLQTTQAEGKSSLWWIEKNQDFLRGKHGNIVDKLLKNKYITQFGIVAKFSEDVTKPKTLRPQRVSFKYEYNGEIYDANIYDLNIVKYSIYNSKNFDRNEKKRVQQEIQNQFNNIDDFGIVELNTPSGPIKVKIIEDSVVTEEAELMMSNINKSVFGQGDKTLAECLENFVPKEIKAMHSTDEQLYLVGNKRKTAILFKKPDANTNLLNMSTAVVFEDGQYKIKMLSPKENEPMFDIGIQVATDEYTYDKTAKRFKKGDMYIDTKDQGNAAVTNDGVRLIYRIGPDGKGKVYKDIYFVQHALNTITSKSGGRQQYSYYIDTEAIKTYLSKTDEQMYKYLGYVINNIAQSTYCTHLQLGDKINKDTIPLIQNVLKTCKSSITGNNRDFYKEVLDLNLETLDFCSDQESDIINLFDIDPKEKDKINQENKREQIQNLRQNKEYIQVLPGKTYFNLLNDASEILSNKIKQSFKLSQYYVASRIPAQSLQSFMKMKLVGYIPINNNECMVSHWQTLLQGSDYDIDKAYIMGYSFDQNGLFQDWSPLFNYDSFKLLNESLKLPTPNKTQIVVNSSATIDISKYIQAIKDLQQQPKSEQRDLEILKTQIKVLTLINEHKEEINGEVKTFVKCDVDNSNDIIKQLQAHEDYEFNPDQREEIYKNSIQSRIQQVSASVKNMPLGYSEITMDDLHYIADEKSSKGNMIYKLTSMNPITKFIMQKQNMDGKAVIGIAAIGEKVFMNLSYYYNEGIRSRDENYKRHLYFERYTTRIEGRSQETPVLRIKQTISDNNYYGIADVETLKNRFNEVNALYTTVKELYPSKSNEEIKAIVDQQIEHNKSNFTQADLMISQLLSAATDNAKELILNKINAGKDLARVYLHLLIQGYDIQDITAFMISPAVDLVAQLQEVDFYDENLNYSKIEKAIERARGFVDPRLYFGKNSKKFIQNFETFLEVQGTNDINRQNSFKGQTAFGDIREYYKQWKKITADDYKTYSTQAHLAFMKYLATRCGINQTKNFYNAYLQYRKLIVDDNSRFTDSNDYKEAKEFYMNASRFIDYHMNLLTHIVEAKSKYKYPTDYELDLDELEKVYAESDETSQLGHLLGWNKEVPTSYDKLLSKINAFEKFIENQSAKFIIYKDNSNEVDIKKTLIEIQKDKPYILKFTNSQEYLEKAVALNIHKNFNFHKFVSDTNYREVAINYYDLIKTQYNILDVLIRSPHQSKALFVYDIAEELIGMNTAKGTIISQMRTKLKQRGEYLNDTKISQLSSYAEDLLINKFLRENQDIIFPINPGQIYYDENFDEHEATNYIPQQITTYDQMASFKRWCESYLFPQISQGEVKIGNDIIKIPEDNEFMEFIIDGSEKGRSIKRLSFNMGFIDKSSSVALQFIKAQRGLNTLDSLNKHKDKYCIKNWIELYSLLTTHNNPGNDRLSKLFGDSLKNPKSLLYRYYQFIGEEDNKSILARRDLDEYLRSLGYNEDDALFHIAPTYYSNSVHNAKETVIKFSKGGKVQYLRKTNPFTIGLDAYSPFLGLEFLNGDPSVSASRQRAFRQDGIGFQYYNSELEVSKQYFTYPENISPDGAIKSVYMGLRRLLQKRKLKLSINC